MVNVNRATVLAHVSAALVVLVLIATMVAPARSAVIRAWHRTESVSSDDSIGSRLDLWRVAIRMIEDHPLVGTGPETFPDEFPRYSRAVLPAASVRHFGRFRVESPHNEVLAVASGAGIPAAIAYLSILVGVVHVLWHARRRSSDAAVRLALLAVMAAVLGHVVTNAFMSSEITGSWLRWTLVGAGIGVASVATADGEGATMSDSSDGLELASEARRDPVDRPCA
jgi:O-antigen ligase